jgi:uncharacterized protein (TIGR02646 family)
MRPVVRGPAPRDSRGRVVAFADYQDAREYLIERIGTYCSYCEMRQPTPAVEHIRGKAKNPHLRREWKNFLLACWSCNSVKGTTMRRLQSFFWPDRDNTARAFAYLPGGRIVVAPNLPKTQKRIAEQTLLLTGINRDASTSPPASDRDRRWRERLIAWTAAERCRTHYLSNPTSATADAVLMVAAPTGFWSVWMAVFHDRPEIRQRLIKEFKGTATACFRKGKACKRTGGRL